jgi:hypothetical protein
MAKKIYRTPLHNTGTTITTKTAYGSTSCMVIDINKYTIEDGSAINIKEDEVVCKDDLGFYITFRNRVDSSTADPNRYANSKNRLKLVEKQQTDT